jgi:hypothetical protein
MDPNAGAPWLPRVRGLGFHDLPHCLRDGLTDVLAFTWATAPHPALGAAAHPAAQLVGDVLALTQRASRAAAGDRRVVDLCAGSGGPACELVRAINARAALDGTNLHVRATLTDLHPHPAAWRERQLAFGADAVAFAAEPVDAARVPRNLPGVRTLMWCFRHFDRRAAKRVLASAAESDSCEGIVVVEVSQRYVALMALQAVALFWLLFLVPLFFSRFSLPRMALTYLLPVLPLMGMWDAVVSSWRSYTPEELLALATEADAQRRMVWTAGTRRVLWWLPAFELVHLVGVKT